MRELNITSTSDSKERLRPEKSLLESAIKSRREEEDRIYRERRELEARLDEIELQEIQGVRGPKHHGFQR